MVPSELESNGALNAIEIVKRKDCEQKGAVPSEFGINFGRKMTKIGYKVPKLF